MRCRKATSSAKWPRSRRKERLSRLTARRSPRNSSKRCLASWSCLSRCCRSPLRRSHSRCSCWTWRSCWLPVSRTCRSSASRSSTSRRSCRETSRSAAITASKWATTASICSRRISCRSQSSLRLPPPRESKAGDSKAGGSSRSRLRPRLRPRPRCSGAKGSSSGALPPLSPKVASGAAPVPKPKLSMPVPNGSVVSKALSLPSFSFSLRSLSFFFSFLSFFPFFSLCSPLSGASKPPMSSPKAPALPKPKASAGAAVSTSGVMPFAVGEAGPPKAVPKASP
mmetsp:Transcript_106489/g.237710  ORF Transcript_106489/g.237710 Transcript_106489/m.237710 type:complete len:282 (-) Transcript_106489:1195-2040(-)